MTVDEFADALISPGLEFLGEGRYENWRGSQGYRAMFRDGSRYFWYSVSNTDNALAPDEVRIAIKEPGRLIKRENTYLNVDGAEGFEASVRSRGRWFMLNVAPNRPT
jgi:hypothetical protein